MVLLLANAHNLPRPLYSCAFPPAGDLIGPQSSIKFEILERNSNRKAEGERRPSAAATAEAASAAAAAAKERRG